MHRAQRLDGTFRAFHITAIRGHRELTDILAARGLKEVEMMEM
jgi:hypothetical protein